MRKHILLLLIIASLALVACGGAIPEAPPIAEAPAATETAPAGETATGQEAGVAEAHAEADAEAAALAAMVAGVTANPWKWTSFSGTDEEFAVEDPAGYMVTFNDDDTVEIQADCNNVSGTYTLDGANVTIDLGSATLAAMSGASRSEQFLQLLGNVASVLPLGNQLYAPSNPEGSTMIFEAVVTTVVDLCGEPALAINTIEDTLSPGDQRHARPGIGNKFVLQGINPGPGASMLIITPQGRYFKSTGVSNVTTCEPLPADSPYQIGSNTKMMTSAILFQLQEEGVLATSDLLSKWLPDLAAQLPFGDQITIDMLMTHTSGLHDYFDLPTEDGTTIEDGTKDKAMLTRPSPRRNWCKWSPTPASATLSRARKDNGITATPVISCSALSSKRPLASRTKRI